VSVGNLWGTPLRPGLVGFLWGSREEAERLRLDAELLVCAGWRRCRRSCPPTSRPRSETLARRLPEDDQLEQPPELIDGQASVPQDVPQGSGADVTASMTPRAAAASGEPGLRAELELLLDDLYRRNDREAERGRPALMEVS
jgi:hypothetical protein